MAIREILRHRKMCDVRPTFIVREWRIWRIDEERKLHCTGR